ncbi:Trm1p [Sugiyamaella lignohabitans]|uniref:tRNA (guanine(26)-N(2))-dimethyltransferase n=1 Tax=Sugiyamaella lignohabitans TaxID=796027 RepID=A0A167C701_9ASCO|nr:Trm1p [Sugiyamaella lignohabitans]ANB11296.1 Trm1p [Sugiyamaella lignohabitans]
MSSSSTPNSTAAAPAVSDSVNTTENKPFDTEKYDEVTEGKASILYPKGNTVFYNPVQQFNRDISIVGIRAWSEIYNEQVLIPRLERSKNAKNKANKKRKRENDEGTVVSEPSTETKVEPESTSETQAETDAATTQDTPMSEANSATAAESSKPYIEIIEALSASGLRAIRYGKEIPYIKKVIANDFSKEAVKSIHANVEHNQIGSRVYPNEGDANIVMYQHKTKNVHVVDLDPYGSATPFMDAAVQSVCDGGLLLVTCTDLAVLAGNSYPEKCFSQYGGNTLNNDSCHEAALRLVLNMVASTAAKYGRAIEPLLSLSIDFYVRCFIRVRSQPALVKFNASKTMIVYNCSGCGTTTCQPLGRATAREKNNHVTYKHSYAQGPTVSSNCEHCGFVHHVAGPMWGGPLHDEKFVSKMLEIHDTLDTNVYKTTQRIKGMLTVAKSELDDTPFFVSLPHLSSVVKAPCPPLTTFASALLNGGYRISGTHCQPASIKTDATASFIWDVMREWIKLEKKGDTKNLSPTSPGGNILKTLETKHSISFEVHPKASELEKQRKSKLVRYQVNPTENWGPKAKAK